MGKYASMGWNNPDHLTGYSYFVTYENDKFVLKENMSQPYMIILLTTFIPWLCLF